MEEKFQRGSIVVNKGAQEFNSKIVILVTGDRSKRDDHFSGVCISTYNHQITPVGEFSDTWHLRKFEKLFDSFEGWLIANQKPQTGPVWVKDRMPDSPGDYYCKCKVDGEPKKLIVEFDKNGRWGEVANYDWYEDLEILEWLDEQK